MTSTTLTPSLRAPRRVPLLRGTAFYFVLFFVLSVVYTNLGFLAYPLALGYALLSWRHLRIDPILAICGSLAGSIVALKGFVGDPSTVGILGKYFFGFLAFIPLFSLSDVEIEVPLDTVLLGLALLTLVEGVLVNTVISPESMPNYPDFALSPTHKSFFFGFLQRPYSFGGNSTMTGTMLVTLLFLCRAQGRLTRFIEACGIAATLACVSGTAMFMLGFYVFTKIRNRMKQVFIVAAAVAAYVVYFSVADLDFASPLMRISPSYIYSLVDLKLDQFFSQYSVLDAGALKLLLGAPFDSGEQPPVWGDFGWGFLIYSVGILGLAVYALAVLLGGNRRNAGALAVLLVSALHYGAVFSIPGQLLFAFTLTQGRRRPSNKEPECRKPASRSATPPSS